MLFRVLSRDTVYGSRHNKGGSLRNAGKIQEVNIVRTGSGKVLCEGCLGAGKLPGLSERLDVNVCLCVCERGREREGGRKKEHREVGKRRRVKGNKTQKSVKGCNHIIF